MGLFRNLTDSFGLTRRETLDLDVAGTFNPVEFVNEILGVKFEQQEFTRADGTKGTRMVATGSSPEMQEFAQSLTDNIQSLVTDINDLSQIGAAINNEAFNPQIQAVREEMNKSRQDAYNQQTRLQEENLARRGLENSTAATEARSQTSDQFAKQASTDENNLILLAEQLRAQALNNASIGLQTSSNERGILSQGAESQRSQSLGLAQGQQALTLNAQQAMFADRTAANAQQAQALGQTVGALAGAFTGGMGMGGLGFGMNNIGTSLKQGVSMSNLMGAF